VSSPLEPPLELVAGKVSIPRVGLFAEYTEYWTSCVERQVLAEVPPGGISSTTERERRGWTPRAIPPSDQSPRSTDGPHPCAPI